MNWNGLIRQSHRWLSIAFTLGVIINGVAIYAGHYARWIGLLAVFPLALQFFSGMYLFVLPYSIRRRREPRTV